MRQRCLVWFLAAVAWLAAGSGVAQEDLTERGAAVAKERCVKCHGADGRGKSADYPSLAGQPAAYIVKQFFNFKTGQRVNEEMMPLVERLTAVEIRAVAQYFASLRPGAVPNRDEALLGEGRALWFRGSPETGIAPCAECHGVYATGGAQMPRLAGQNPVYLEKQLRSFIQRIRQNDALMHLSLAAMKERQVKAVAAYLGNDD